MSQHGRSRLKNDEGLFGPSSITWRLHADPMMGLAGLRALLLQALHPVAAESVSRRSAFGEDVWARLTRTAHFVGITTYGSAGAALTAGARVRAEHASMHGVDPPTDAELVLDDPELLGWVHCCLVESTVSVLDRAGVGLDEDDADRYVGEQVRSAALVGLDPGDVPGDLAELRSYFRQLRPQLRATPAARTEASYVIGPGPARYAAVARPAWSSVAGLAFAALPPWARHMYAMPELPGASALHGAATTVAMHALRASLRGVQVVVPPLREGPHLRSARERLAAEPPVAEPPVAEPAAAAPPAVEPAVAEPPAAEWPADEPATDQPPTAGRAHR